MATEFTKKRHKLEIDEKDLIFRCRSKAVYIQKEGRQPSGPAASTMAQTAMKG
jgi:hypothetical protein